MATHGKKYRKAAEQLDSETVYTLDGAIQFLKANQTTKFDQTAEIAFRLGVDPTKSDQAVRGTVVLPNGTGKNVTVLVFANGPAADAARAAGADFVGFEDMLEKVKGGFTGFDVAIATPDMMGVVGRLGKILGPRGLMPNPKLGTVTMDLTKAVTEAKAGKIEYRTDKAGNIHCPIGKASFEADKLVENYRTLIDTLNRVKPAAAKGQYMKSITLAATMGPGVPVTLN